MREMYWLPGGEGEGGGGGRELGGGAAVAVSLAQRMKPPYVTLPSVRQLIDVPGVAYTLTGGLAEPRYCARAEGVRVR